MQHRVKARCRLKSPEAISVNGGEHIVLVSPWHESEQAARATLAEMVAAVESPGWEMLIERKEPT